MPELTPVQWASGAAILFGVLILTVHHETTTLSDWYWTGAAAVLGVLAGRFVRAVREQEEEEE